MLVGKKDDQVGFKHHSDLNNEPKKFGRRILLNEPSPFRRDTTLPVGPRSRMVINKNLGMLMLAIFLIVYGIVTTLALAIPVVILGILALIAGILILIGR